MQKTFSKEFKFKVAMEAIKGDLTIAEIISKYQVSKTTIHDWKRLVLGNGSSIFGQKKGNVNLSVFFWASVGRQ